MVLEEFIMNFSRHFSSVFRFVQGLLVALVCAVMLFTSASPALAADGGIGSSPSRPNQGEAQLKDIIKESQDAIRPENALDSDKVIDRANKGLNEVQEDADAQEMNRPENSRQAKSAAEQVQRALGKAVDKVTGRD
jgi:hypothetical protein